MAAAPITTQQPLVLKFGGSLVEQLGAQLYPSATATVAELISNAWDADAENVWITIPLGDKWSPDSEVVVIDDGIGMTRHDAQACYLVVGRKRRVEEGTDETSGGRKLHGRKGIGKLAAFGTAGVLECVTLRDGEVTAFRLDYDEIRKLSPTEDYTVADVEDPPKLVSPETGSPLDHGSRIRLTRLWLKRALPEEQFLRSMSRRFSISQAEMRVFINGQPLSRFDIPLQFRFPRDAEPTDDSFVSREPDDWGRDQLPDGRQVRWWIGFTKDPLEDESLQGVSVLARGKLAQRPFMFERAKGTEGQLGQEYLVGEVEADWLDSGIDIEDDLIQSNRDMLQLEDERLDEFIQWGRRRLAWALRARNRKRQELVETQVETSPEVEELLKPFTKTEQTNFRRIAKSFSKLPEVEPDDAVDLMRQVINAQSDVAVRSLMEQIQEEEEPIQERMWALVHEFGLIDARRVLTLIEARIETIERLQEAVAKGAKEVPDIHNIIVRDVWLLDPRWHLLDHELDPQKLGISYKPEEDESGQQIDFLFVLAPRAPATIDEVVVVEIKRGTHPSGSVRKADEGEVDKFAGYVLAVKDHYSKSTTQPRVTGLMIAQDYTPAAKLKRALHEQVGDPKLLFKTWDLVIDETHRMHLGWLEVSKKRAEDKST